ncbi:MAG TPA: isoaspartyl peptidase/L-asparaginase [Caulobacterales bacterium]|nr:isoaspartyl peptidase/L-asparaginase [Caulobacterales bacterium]
MNWALALHGGAGAMARESYEREEMHMRALLDDGVEMLSRGKNAVEVVTEMVAALEASGFHVAGKGAGPNAIGEYELDAAIMDGRARAAGAVAALQGFISPIRIARAVMEDTPHVMLVGNGAAAFARAREFPEVGDPVAYYTPARSGLPGEGKTGVGTVGCVARDLLGNLAAATSTGGIKGKLPGRVGDSPVIGAGCWADKRVAISCTGLGEFFIRANVAADVSARMAYARQTLEQATRGALDDMVKLGGDGGLIAVDAECNIATPFTSPGMKRAWATGTGIKEVKTFR